MSRLWNSVCGYVDFTFTKGFAEGFLNECFNNQVNIRHIVRTSDGIVAEADIKTYKFMHRIAYRHGGKVKIIKKHGMPFLLSEVSNRWGFFCGMAAFVMIISFLSGFIWNIEWKGFNNVQQAKVENCLKENGFERGVMWSGVDAESLSYMLMADFDDVSWAHINKIGTTARIEINSGTAPPNKKSDKEKSSVGVFRREIVLTVNRTVSESIPIKRDEYKSVYFYGLTIPLYLGHHNFTKENTKSLIINGVTLPISVTVHTAEQFDKREYILDDNQLIALAKNELATAKENAFSDNVTVVNENIKTELNETSCVITGSYIIRDNNIWRQKHK